MKEFLVDYILKDSNAAAIANLYEERLVEKLLSVQDAQQREKLSSKEEEIVSGKRVNRLCDLFYKAYGSMKEGKWPSCKEHVELRALLAILVLPICICSLFFTAKVAFKTKGWKQILPLIVL